MPLPAILFWCLQFPNLNLESPSSPLVGAHTLNLVALGAQKENGIGTTVTSIGSRSSNPDDLVMWKWLLWLFGLGDPMPIIVKSPHIGWPNSSTWCIPAKGYLVNPRFSQWIIYDIGRPPFTLWCVSGMVFPSSGHFECKPSPSSHSTRRSGLYRPPSHGYLIRVTPPNNPLH